MYAASFSEAQSKPIWQSPKLDRPYADSEKILAAIRKQLRGTAVLVQADETSSETASEMFWRLAAERATG